MGSVIWLATLLAIAAGAAFAVTAALQHRAAAQEAVHHIADPRLLLRLLRRPLWLASNLTDLLGAALQAVALRFGPLALVQPLLVSSLIFAPPAEAALNRHPVNRRSLFGAGLGVLGLALFVLSGATSAGTAHPSTRAWLLSGIATAAVVGVCLVGAAQAVKPWSAVWLGIATGTMYGYMSALLKTCSTQFPHLGALFGHWHVYAFALVGCAGLVLNQSMYQHGSLAPGLTALTISEPLSGFVFGTTAFGESVATSGLRLTALVVAVGLLVAAVWTVASDREEQRHSELPAHAH